jgi:hypothetical protein
VCIGLHEIISDVGVLDKHTKVINFTNIKSVSSADAWLFSLYMLMAQVRIIQIWFVESYYYVFKPVSLTTKRKMKGSHCTNILLHLEVKEAGCLVSNRFVL